MDRKEVNENNLVQEDISENNAGIGVVEIILILVVLIALVLIFKDQITKIVEDAFTAITGNADAIIQ